MVTVLPRSPGPSESDGLEEEIPSRVPARDDRLARVAGLALELAVAIAIGLFAVAREEVGPSRAHVAGDVLDDERNAVGVGVEQREELRIVDLRHRLVGLRLQLAQLEQAIVKEVLFDQWAFSMWTR